MTTADVIIAASRLPETGGLFDALVFVARELSAVWVGGGAADVQPPSLGIAVRPVPLTPPELRDEQDGCSGSIIWPLYHDIGVGEELDRADWMHYVAVNAKVAAAVEETAARGALVWAHGHQLQLLPRMLRKRRPDLRIGLSLHLPFPPPALFERLPWRRQLLLGLLGADLVAVPGRGDAHNLARCVRDQLGGHGSAPHLRAPDGHVVRVRTHPAAVHTSELAALARSAATQRRMAQLRHSLGGPAQIFLGISRLDHSTGLPQRMRAFAELYADQALDPAEVSVVQVVTPRHGRPARTDRLAREVERMVGDLNARYGHLGRMPVAYVSRHLPLEERVALLRLADVMVAAPLRGGMGLVAKEYLACRCADDGALVLSEFAAVTEELCQAYVVNPHDLEAFKHALLAAATDDPVARAQRMHALRRHVRDRDAHRWAADFLDDLARG